MDFITSLTELTGKIAGMAWGVPTVVVLVGTGIYLTIRMRFIQIRGFKHAISLVSGKHDSPDDPGEVTHFQALSTALSATVGTGNIAGVATAIALGGPGAVFWMWITAFFGMATKYTSCTLALKYRDINDDGEVAGGPMYTLAKGLNMPILAGMFATFTLIASFGIGNMVQANSVVDGLGYLFPDVREHAWVLGVILGIMVAMVILGGVKRIASVAARIVPFMAIFYCSAALLILIINIEQVPSAFVTIFNLALNPWAAGGGAIGAAMQYGVARGVFSNEAGLGSAPMAHAAAKTKEPVREGLVALLEPFIDTLIICTMTALVIVISGAWGDARPEELKGAALSAHAFQLGLSSLGEWSRLGAWVVGIGLTFFAYSTIISWSYYGDRSARYLFGESAVLPYRVIYACIVVLGAALPLSLVWNLADIANVFMAVPNLISLVLLAGLVSKMGDNYFEQQKGR